MRYQLLTCDVFTDRRFGGNPLAVLPDGAGLETAAMQAIAAEMNLSETSFILPPRHEGELAFVRIFTPSREMPFAGHPTIGTALTMARLGRIQPPAGGDGETGVVLGELAGPVPVQVHFQGGRPVLAELTAPARPQLGEEFDIGPLAEWLGLSESDLVAGPAPRTASCGTPFLEVELASRDALARARIVDVERFPQARPGSHGFPGDARLGVHLFTRDLPAGEGDLALRMFAPRAGVPEDPATGSAACALGGLLALADPAQDAEFSWRMVQGVEMRRPSLLLVSASKVGGEVTAVRVAGSDVPVIEGWIEA